MGEYYCNDCKGKEGYVKPCRYSSCFNNEIRVRGFRSEFCPIDGTCIWKLIGKKKR